METHMPRQLAVKKQIINSVYLWAGNKSDHDRRAHLDESLMSFLSIGWIPTTAKTTMFKGAFFNLVKSYIYCLASFYLYSKLFFFPSFVSWIAGSKWIKITESDNSLIVSYCCFPINAEHLECAAVPYCPARYLKGSTFSSLVYTISIMSNLRHWRRVALRLICDIIGAHSWMHQSQGIITSKEKSLKTIVCLQWYLMTSQLLRLEHCNCPAFIVLNRQISVHFFSMGRQTELT